MVAIAKFDQKSNSEVLHLPMTDIEAMANAGCFLLPLGGDDGKAPLFKGWNKQDRRRTSKTTLLKMLERNFSTTFGVRLDGLCVVDCDTRTDETLRYVERNFPPTEFAVETSRGWHFYYRLADKQATFTRKIEVDGIKIDVKAGYLNQVVGPGSIRPDGKQYKWQSKALAKISDLPLFTELSNPLSKDPKPAAEKPSNVLRLGNSSYPMPKGVRNRLLCKTAIQYVRLVVSRQELFDDLAATRDIECDDPSSVSDIEIGKIADWAWGLRLENRLYAGRASEFRLARRAMDLCFSQESGGPNAWSLYSIIIEQHAHRPNAVFAIAIEAMVKSFPNFPLSKGPGYAARALLERLGLIVCVKPAVMSGRRTLKAAQYRLANALTL